MKTGSRHRRLGEFLLAQGLLDGEQLEGALERHRRTGKRLGQCLVEMGALSERDIAVALSNLLGVPLIDLEDAEVDPALACWIPEHIARRYEVVPTDISGGNLTLGMVDPLNVLIIEEVQMLTGQRVKGAVVTPAGFAATMEKLYGTKARERHVLADLEQFVDEEGGEWSCRAMAAEEPAMALFEHLLLMAYKRGATDLLLLPEAVEEQLAHSSPARARDDPTPGSVDGLLISFQRYRDPAGKLHVEGRAGRALVNHLRARASRGTGGGMSPFSVVLDGRPFLARVRFLREVSGESVSVRLIEPCALWMGLEDLSLRPEEMGALEQALARPPRLILAAGPSGSGTTTTLYVTALRAIRDGALVVSLQRDPDFVSGEIVQLPIEPPRRGDRIFERLLEEARSLKADVVLADEPTDPGDARLLLRYARPGRTVLMPLKCGEPRVAAAKLADLEIAPAVPGGVRLLCIWHDSVGHRSLRRMDEPAVG